MKPESQALLKNCKASRSVDLHPDSLVAEVQALHRKIGASLATLNALRLDHGLVHAGEDDPAVRGELYEIGSKLAGLERVGREAQDAQQKYLAALREYGELVERLDEKYGEKPKKKKAATP